MANVISFVNGSVLSNQVVGFGTKQINGIEYYEVFLKGGGSILADHYQCTYERLSRAVKENSKEV